MCILHFALIMHLYKYLLNQTVENCTNRIEGFCGRDYN